MLLDDIRALVADVLERDAESIGPDATPEEVPEWDSVRHLTLILALEQRFGVDIDPGVVPGLTSPRRIADYFATGQLGSESTTLL